MKNRWFIGLFALALNLAYAGQEPPSRGMPTLSKVKAKPTPASKQPLTRYEFAVAMKEFMTRLEKGLTEGFQKTIYTGTSGALPLSSRHPAWAREAVAELQVRGLIDPKTAFNGNLPLTRYDFALIVSRYIRKLDQLMTQRVGKPVRADKTTVRIRLNVPKNHPAYRAILFLYQNRWLPYTSNVFKGSTETMSAQEVADAFAFIMTRFVERYTDEEMWAEKYEFELPKK